MRQIGTIDTESQARVFRSYLLTLGIHADVDQTRDRRWAIWVHEENRLDDGRRELEQFLADPRKERYQAAARAAETIEKEAVKDNRKFKARQVDLRTAWHKSQLAGGALTLTLIFMSVAAFLLQQFPSTSPIVDQWLYFAKLTYAALQDPFIQIKQGQVWRLITPIFLHANFIHILFNMMWLRTLGGMIEAEEGSLRLGLQVLTFAILSNVMQATLAGPAFLGMSGVNYGLFGYVWLVGRYSNSSRFQLDQVTIYLMLGWFVACWIGLMGPVANWAHTGGLIMGAIWAVIKIRRIPFTALRW